MISPSRVQSFSAGVALAGAVLAAISLVAVSLLRPDLNVLRNSLSYYANGPWGPLQTLAFVALGVTSIALAIALKSRYPPTRSLRVCVSLLFAAGVAALGLAMFPMGGTGPSTLLGDAHQTAGTIGGVAELAATLAFIGAFHSDANWHQLTQVAKVVFAISLAGAVVTQVEIWRPELDIPMGASMRLVVIPLLIFWGTVALRLCRTSGCSLADPSPRGDNSGVHTDEIETAKESSVLDLDAAVHDDFESRLASNLRRLRTDHTELHPEDFRPDRRCRARERGRLTRPAKDVDDVNWMWNLFQ
jgi:hypothetical membrane protein